MSLRNRVVVATTSSGARRCGSHVVGTHASRRPGHTSRARSIISAGQFAPFNTTTAGYEDNVVSWPSVEPAADYTAASLFAFAPGGAGLG
jgi:hypothetical protein